MLKIIETEHLSDVQTWVASIRAAYARTVESVIAVGRELIAAKVNLPHGEFERMVRKELPFKERTAQMLMAIASCQHLCEPEVRPLLPNALSSLYELSRVPRDVWDSMLAGNAITAEKTANELVQSRDIHTVLVRGERPKPAAKNLAAVIPIKPLTHTSGFIAPPVTPQQEPRAIEGELLPIEPRTPEPALTPQQGRTIDVGSSTGPRQYQNHEQLLRAARKFIGREFEDRGNDKAELLAWMVAYDGFRMGL